MRFRLMVGLVVLLVAAGCANGGSGSPTDPFTLPTLPELPDPPPPLAVEAEDLTFGDLRKVVGSWELVSFPSGPFTSSPTLRFGFERTNERGDLFNMSWVGPCGTEWGRYVVVGPHIRVYSWGGNLLLGRVPDHCPDEADEHVFNLWLHQAESWSVNGEVLLITDTDGATAEFRRVVEFPDPQLVDDDGLETVAPRLHFVDESGFLALVQEQEDADGGHGSEALNWIAWSPGTGEASVDGFDWQTEGLVSPITWVWNRRVRDSFTAVEFPDGFDEGCLLADMNSLNGTNTASVRYRPTEQGAELLVDEEESSSPETGHTDEILRALVVDCSVERFPAGVTVGRVDGATDEWTRVDFGQLILDPVVVAGPASLNGSDPGVIEVRKVTSLSFEIRFHEWDYLDGIHPTGETVSCVVAERGTTVLPSGAHIEAGTIAATPTMTEVLFESPFPETPVVISTVLR